MSYSQLITPNPNIPCMPGWCLQYVRQAYGLPAAYPTATAAWNGSASKHRDRQFPKGMWTPVWFSLANEPAGHVALMAPDGSVYSTSDLSNKPHHHLDLSDLMNYYARYDMTLTYLGWTEDVAGFPVMASDGIAAMGTTADKIITKLQEAGVALELKDLQAIQGLVQTERATIVNEIRFGFAELAKKVADTGYDVKVFAQASDQQERATVVNEVRAAHPQP